MTGALIQRCGKRRCFQMLTFYQFLSLLDYRKTRVTVPKRMNFSENPNADFGPLHSAFWPWFRQKICNMNFQKWERELFRKLSVLVPSTVPKKEKKKVPRSCFSSSSPAGLFFSCHHLPANHLKYNHGGGEATYKNKRVEFYDIVNTKTTYKQTTTS